MLLEWVVDVCVACAGGGPAPLPGLLGTAGAPGTGPAPGGNPPGGNPPGGGSPPGGGPPPDGGPSPDGGPPPDGGPEGDPPEEKSWWDSLFGSDPVDDAAESLAQDVGTGIILDGVGTKLPWSAGALGAAGTIVGGSQVLADGVGTIAENKGRGLGGSSEGGKKVWEWIENNNESQKAPDDD